MFRHRVSIIQPEKRAGTGQGIIFGTRYYRITSSPVHLRHWQLHTIQDVRKRSGYATA